MGVEPVEGPHRLRPGYPDVYLHSPSLECEHEVIPQGDHGDVENADGTVPRHKSLRLAPCRTRTPPPVVSGSVEVEYVGCPKFLGDRLWTHLRSPEVSFVDLLVVAVFWNMCRVANNSMSLFNVVWVRVGGNTGQDGNLEISKMILFP